MVKIRKYANGIERFLHGQKGQRFFNFAYSIGAAIVIWGALFKILHLPGGATLLCIGMGTEIAMFILTAFDRPPKEYAWEEVFPILDSHNPEDRPDISGGGGGGGTVIVNGRPVETSGNPEEYYDDFEGEYPDEESDGESHRGSHRGFSGGGVVGGVIGGVPGGVIGGVPGGIVGGVVGGVPGGVIGGVPGGIVGGIVGGVPGGYVGGGAGEYSGEDAGEAGEIPAGAAPAGSAGGFVGGIIGGVPGGYVGGQVPAVVSDAAKLGISEEEAGSLRESINKLAAASEQISLIADLADVTRSYVESMGGIAEQMTTLQQTTAALNEVSSVLLDSYRSITDNSESVTASSAGYVDRLEDLNRNIGGLNTIYEIQLKSISSQLESIDRVNRGLKDIRDMYEKSAAESSRYCEETEKMARYMKQLNSVYEKMITAMTINMYNPMMGGVRPGEAPGDPQNPFSTPDEKE